MENLDHTKYKMAGVPFAWKCFFYMLLICRIVILWKVFQEGLFWLMGTGGIVDLILNSLAITFILDVDKLLLGTFARGITKDIMVRLQPFQVKDEPSETRRIYNEYKENQTAYSSAVLMKSVLSSLLYFFIFLLIVLGMHYYYFINFCTIQKWPFDIWNWGGESYFEGQTRFFGGMEFFFGTWLSENITDAHHEVTCRPFNYTGHNNPAVGCGLPTPWHPNGQLD
mmetsp:Transcript_8953/g.18844  ORF Transcript_8953/g.18844 Transcript_8953/m.18844 type:complete len:225 (-) Transcript_8953:95-769(-)